ncbi:type III secretion system gatekeeper subunit SctW [Rouxiella badensis]|uniref:type III secretion system gatekeeper subunit SctW n=1 Tax=Rouxiella badensis TaxID=1646377 RepID=UPI00301E362B
MSSINRDYSHSPLLRVREHQRAKAQAEKESSNEKVRDEGELDSAALSLTEDDSSADLIARASQNVDESLIALSQFRSRRDLTLKSGADAENNFDSILDDNTLPKIALLLKMVSGVQGNSIQDMHFRFLNLFPDESDRVLILRKLLKRKNLDETTRKNISTLLENTLQAADPRRLQAGLNIAVKARLFGQFLDINPQLLRSAYRYFIESDDAETVIYKNWISIFGYKKRKTILELIEEFLLTDIDALDPSCSLTEFGNVLLKLNQLKRLRTVDGDFIGNLLLNENIFNVNESEEAWLLFFFCVLQDARNLEEYLNEVAGEFLMAGEPSGCVRFVQALYIECSKIPVEFFDVSEDKSWLEEHLKDSISFHFENEIIKFKKLNH